MRVTDASIVLVGAVLGFGAVAVGLAAGSVAAAVPFLVLAAAAVAIGVARMAVTRRVLLVANPRHAAQRALEAALDDAGFAVQRCSGPSYWACPLLKGQDCPVRRNQVAVVAYHPPDYTGPVPLCGLALGVPWLTVEAGSDTNPIVGTRAARVGAGRGAPVVAATLHTLLEEAAHAGSETRG